MSWARAIYHRLPYPGRRAAATLRGAWLRSRRRSARSESLSAAALARERWPAASWLYWQQVGLAAALARARMAPFYQRLGGLRSQLRDWPVLTKATVRESPSGFLTGDSTRGLVREHTSGSTGTPLTVWWSRRASAAWYALVEARMRHWNGVADGERWAILGGQLVTPVAQQRPPYWVWNAAMRQLYLSSYHLSAAAAPAYLEAMREHRVRYLLGYPSAMAALGQLALEAGLQAPQLAVAIANAEPLSWSQRSRIGEAFGCPVRDSYGMAELVVGASECESGRMHLWPEVGVVEVLDEGGAPVPPGEVGRLVCTGLLNDAMALVRYDTGDRGALDPDQAPCTCGRTLPRLLTLEGRQDDVLQTPDGRLVGRLDPVFKSELPIREAQIVQQAIDLVVVRVVPAIGFDDAVAERIRQELTARLGSSVGVEVVAVQRLERGAAGKLRGVVSLAERG